jgi:site-specific DNA-methyltransferase (adenine-specific)
MLPLNELYNMDCMEGMKQFPDKYFELAIVDPPYGIGERIAKGGSSSPFIKSQAGKIKEWDIAPNESYFNELRRVSQNQIIWGGNHFVQYLSNFRCFIFWDKTIHGNSYADGELAWTSFDMPARCYKENISIITSEGRIHPTQKSTRLYKWLLTNYAKPGDKILDTHVGSASSLIACHNYGFEYIGFEIDPDYYKAAKERIEAVKNQASIFTI